MVYGWIAKLGHAAYGHFGSLFREVTMHVRQIAIAAGASLGLIVSATAAELTGAEIKDLFSGKTIYLETTGDSVTGTPGKGIIYFAPDGSGLYKTPQGAMWHGTWAIKDNTNCSIWKEASSNACNKYDKQGDTISIINATTGKVRAKITRTAVGNVEKLAP
jgi:hypothetical protein